MLLAAKDVRMTLRHARAGKTHRLLFSEFYQDLMHESLEGLLAEGSRPAAGVTLFHQMMRDIMSGGQQSDVIAQVCFSSSGLYPYYEEDAGHHVR